MKLLIILFLMTSVALFSQNLQELRCILKDAENSETSTKVLVEKSHELYSKTKLPIYQGFLAVAHFFLAQQAFNPLKKLKFFKKGKELLDGAISKDSDNVELRYFRLMSQENAPKFLNYYQNKEEDYLFIRNKLPTTNDAELAANIRKFLNK